MHDKVEGKVGATTYTIEYESEMFAKLTRTSADGQQVTFYPRALLMDFCMPTVRDAVADEVSDAIAKRVHVGALVRSER